MALDQIWMQQLALVSYGNEYLQQNLTLEQWSQHAIFYQHIFLFRDLRSQHLLAQHFIIWLEGLKKQGVQRLTLHSTKLLDQEQNPNPNVELLFYPHFMVSHHNKQKTAWIFGNELAEWYTSDQDFVFPAHQRTNIRTETLYRYECSDALSKAIHTDLQPVDWNLVTPYLEAELFHNQWIQSFSNPTHLDTPFYGLPISQIQDAEGHVLPELRYLSLIPSEYSADLAHQLLHRMQALSNYINDLKTKVLPVGNESDDSPERQASLRYFSDKVDDLFAKLIVKVANFYASAKITPMQGNSPLEPHLQAQENTVEKIVHKVGTVQVLQLIIFIAVMVLIAYYFGF